MIRSDVRIEALFLWSNSCLFLFLRSDNLTISCWHSSTDCDSSQISCLRSQLISHTDMMVCFLSWKNITFLLVETIKAVVVKKCDLQSLGSLQEVLNKSLKQVWVWQISANQRLVWKVSILSVKATHIDDFPGGLGVGEDVSDELLSQIVIFNVKHLGGLDENSDDNNINAEGQGHLIKVDLHLRGALLLSVQGLELTNWWYGDNLSSPSPPPSP